MKWKKVMLIAIVIITVWITISDCTYLVDSSRISSNCAPIFILHTEHLDDGGTTIYYGMGYQLISWKKLAETSNQYLTGIEKHYLFGMRNPLDGPQIELNLEEI